MYEYLKGKLDSIQGDYLVVDVNSVGYKVFTSQNTIRNAVTDSSMKIFTQLIVKEDEMVIYGFDTKDELNMFKMLNTVSGVGPKAAVSLLNHYKPHEIALAIISKDVAKITKAQGIGKKTAERLILELKDKIDSESAIGLQGAESFGGEVSEVIEALTTLGYSYSDAAQAVAKLTDKEAPIDVMIKGALRILAVM